MENVNYLTLTYHCHGNFFVEEIVQVLPLSLWASSVNVRCEASFHPTNKK